MRDAAILVLVLATSTASADNCPPSAPALGDDGRKFPARIGPALSGDLAALKWGMSPADVDTVAPRLAKAVYARLDDDSKERGDRETYQLFAGGEIQLRIDDMGLNTIYLRYRSRAAALKALAAWKAPASPKNAQRFEFWTSTKGRTRALLRPDDKGVVVEITPFRPLAEHIDALLAPSGRPLLGMAKADLCLPALDEDKENFVVPASERSSGYYTYRVTWKADKVASFITQIDYTYDRTVKDQVARLLAKKLGTSKPVSTPSGKSCDTYESTPIVYACSSPGITALTIYVGKEP